MQNWFPPQNPPVTYTKAIQGSDEISIDGFVGDVWTALSQVLNFTVKIYPSVDGKWGSIESNGNWNGMMGMLLRNEVDAISSDMALTLQRGQVADFTTPINSEM